MRRFAEAVVVYEDILTQNPEEKLSAESLKFAKLRAAQASGDIDAREIYFTQKAVAAAQKGAEVCADFISDALVIGNINGQKGGGRGLFCKRSVKKGELLMVSRNEYSNQTSIGKMQVTLCTCVLMIMAGYKCISTSTHWKATSEANAMARTKSITGRLLRHPRARACIYTLMWR